jgi:diazepam-binding inhibitor (GABA receptor modulator, acyl-CoA-binding protein)
MTFEEAQEKVQNLSQRPENVELLKLYALFKQAMEGDNNGEAPSNPFDFAASAKFNAWKEIHGKPKEESVEEYIALSEELISKYG